MLNLPMKSAQKSTSCANPFLPITQAFSQSCKSDCLLSLSGETGGERKDRRGEANKKQKLKYEQSYDKMPIVLVRTRQSGKIFGSLVFRTIQDYSGSRGLQM